MKLPAFGNTSCWDEDSIVTGVTVTCSYEAALSRECNDAVAWGVGSSAHNVVEP